VPDAAPNIRNSDAARRRINKKNKIFNEETCSRRRKLLITRNERSVMCGADPFACRGMRSIDNPRVSRVLKIVDAPSMIHATMFIYLFTAGLRECVQQK